MPTKPQQAAVQIRNGASDKPQREFETEVIILNQCRKIFIQRDYSRGLDVQFEAEYPARLCEKVSRDTWENTIMRINKIFADAEAITATTVFETLLGCLTCYASYALTKSSYSKKLEELQEFLDRENKEIYHRVGFHLRNPMERGLRVLEISVLSRQGETPRDEEDMSNNIQGAAGPIRTI